MNLCIRLEGGLKNGGKSTHIRTTNSTILDLDIDVVVLERLGLKIDELKVVPIVGIMNARKVSTNVLHFLSRGLTRIL